MLPLTTLYDDYIDRPKLTGQKNPFEYAVPSLTKMSRKKYSRNLRFVFLFDSCRKDI